MWISECFPARGNMDPGIMAEYELADDWTITVIVDPDAGVRVEGEDGLAHADSDDPLLIGDGRVLRGDAVEFVAEWQARFFGLQGPSPATRRLLRNLDDHPKERAQLAALGDPTDIKSWCDHDCIAYTHSLEGEWDSMYDDFVDSALDAVDWALVFDCLKDWPATRVRMGWDKEGGHVDQ